MMHLKTILQNLLITVMALSPAIVFALESDNEQPINIEADHAQMDDKEGVAQYKGRAILTQGTLRIEGDILTFYFDENNEIKKATAQGVKGNLAKYQQVETVGESPIRAKALRIEYYAADQKINLLGEGYVWQNGDEFTGNTIKYDIVKNVVDASAAAIVVDGVQQDKGRIHIIMQPAGAKNKTLAPKTTPAVIPTETVVSDKTITDYPQAVTTMELNIRTGPGTQYAKLALLDQGHNLRILTEQKEWLQVRCDVDGEVIIGWVFRRYTKTLN